MKKAKIKEQQTKTKKVEEYNPFSWTKLIVFLLVIILILGGFYLLTDRIVKNNKVETKEEEQEKINERANNNINYSDVKDIKENNYYLLFYTEEDENNSMYDLYINSLKANNMSDKFYYINLDGEENKSIVDKKSSLKDIEKIKVKGSTLIHVEDKKVKETFEGGEKILKHLAAFFNIETENTTSNTNSNKTNSNSTSTKTSNKK